MAGKKKRATKEKERPAVKKDFMTFLPAELIIKIFKNLQIKDTWRLQQISRLWKDKLSSVDALKAAANRWNSHEFTEESALIDRPRPLNRSIQSIRQHHLRYPAVRILDPIVIRSMKSPFHQGSLVAEPMLAGHIALICTDKQRYRFQVIDLDTHQRWEVPLPSTFNEYQDQFQGKALSTRYAAFWRSNVCYLFDWQNDVLRPIAFPTIKQHIKILAVALCQHSISIVASNGEESWLLFEKAGGFMYLPMPVLPVTKLGSRTDCGGICTAYLDVEKFVFFWLVGTERKYALMYMIWNIQTGMFDRRSVDISFTCLFTGGGSMACHSTGIKNDMRIRITGQEGALIAFYNVILDLETEVISDIADMDDGGTSWKSAGIICYGDWMMYRTADYEYAMTSEELMMKAPLVKMNCFALYEGASLLQDTNFDMDRYQSVVMNESYMVTGTFKSGLGSWDTNGLVWDFFSFNSQDEGIPLVVDKQRSTKKEIYITLAR